jgi:hypothetical protein
MRVSTLILVLVLISGNVFAKCAQYPPDMDAAYSEAEEIVLVDVQSIVDRGASEFFQYRANYSVVEEFKNRNGFQLNFATFWSETHSLQMEKGVRYLLFISGKDRSVSICDGSRRYVSDQKLLGWLRDRANGI